MGLSGFQIILLIILGVYLFRKLKPKKDIKNKKPNEKVKENENEFIQCDKCYTFVLKKDTILINNKRLCKECYENS